MGIRAIVVRMVALLLLPLPCLATKYQVQETLQTDLGTVQAAREIVDTIDGNDIPGNVSVLLLDGKQVFRDDLFMYLGLHGIYHVPNGQAVLFHGDCGGSGCRIHPLYFLIIHAAGQSKVVSDQAFYSETLSDDDIKGKVKGGATVLVDLGFENMQGKTAILESERLKIVWTKKSDADLPAQDCSALFELQDLCVEHRRTQLDCADLYSASDQGFLLGGNATEWTLRRESQMPGFNEKGFNQTCKAACDNGSKGTYESFRKAACTTRR